MSKELFGITFQAWHLWKYAPLFAGLIGLYAWIIYKKFDAINCLASPQWRSLLLKNASLYRLYAKFIMYCLGIFFLFFSLLQPGWGKKEEVIEQQGRDVLIALDVSKSMLAQDRSPHRLAFAKKKIKDLVHNVQCERVGLILFSGSAIVQCPLTSDYKAFFMFLDQLDAETISSGTTALDQALQKALHIFESMPSRKHKLLVIFTDGEDFSSNLAGIRAQAMAIGLKIFTIGLGTLEGAPIPLYDDHGYQIGHQKDQKGTVVISRLNEGILRSLAEETGGIYFRAEDNDNDIKRLVDQVQRIEKESFEDKQVIHVQERYPYFIATSFLCFALEWLL
jgi:Ca-activated chloride channel family protein